MYRVDDVDWCVVKHCRDRIKSFEPICGHCERWGDGVLHPAYSDPIGNAAAAWVEYKDRGCSLLGKKKLTQLDLGVAWRQWYLAAWEHYRFKKKDIPGILDVSPARVCRDGQNEARDCGLGWESIHRPTLRNREADEIYTRNSWAGQPLSCHTSALLECRITTNVIPKSHASAEDAWSIY